MQRKFMAPVLGLSLALVSMSGVVSAQEVTPGITTNANGSNVSSTPGNTANGDGPAVIYGDITTGPGTTVIGPPSTSVTAPPPVPVDPAPAPVDTGTAPVDPAPAPVDPAPAPVDPAAAPVDTTSTAPVPVVGDADGDNLPDELETNAGTDIYTADTDGDGAADGDEVNIYNTDPRAADTDGDGLTDGNELFWTNSDSLLWDTDGDGWSDGDEVNNRGTNPIDAASFPGAAGATGDTAAAPVSGYTAPTETTTTPVDTVSSNVGATDTVEAAPGATTALGDGSYVTSAPGVVESPTVSSGAGAPAAVAAVSCGDYGTWYDAQVAYEAAGGTSSTLAAGLDPNYDGVACESLQV